MSEVTIQVQDLAKRYRIGRRQQRPQTLAHAVVDALRAPLDNYRRLRAMSHFRGDGAEDPDMIWALRDVSFDVPQGEVMGIIGRNGAGKSTLLKILSRITEPSGGRAVLNGRIASLLEVGTGFHPDLTGRENVYLNGTLLGMRKAEVDRRFDEIVDFAGVEKFIDTPVRFYSSGMRVRLAFSVAAHLEAEILLLDEVLAVGDVEFQAKCLGKMENVAYSGRTVLFVSHNMAAIENLCSTSLLLEQGQVAALGPTPAVLERYYASIERQVTDGGDLAQRTDRRGNGQIRLISFHIEDTTGRKLSYARSGMDIIFVFGYQTAAHYLGGSVDMGFSIHDKVQMLSVLYSSYAGTKYRGIPHRGFFRCMVPRFPFTSGYYDVRVRARVDEQDADWPEQRAGQLAVEPGDFYATGQIGFASAPVMLDGKWELGEHGSIPGAPRVAQGA
ncbi:MAG: ATP-binding cassette domain-containing protein [Caldilineaceae bacterium]|nr:ATP-binding cassette domain-containing protein [Caldilineaceae bacterium]